MTDKEIDRLLKINRLRSLGWTYDRIARRFRRFKGRDRLYQWLLRVAVKIDGEWVPRDEVVRAEEVA